ncbi:sigma-70 family RNA polymerase sigma factor [bacterium]|nr:sigma-70 family RNA polymerase sigma factor [bacterium]
MSGNSIFLSQGKGRKAETPRGNSEKMVGAANTQAVSAWKASAWPTSDSGVIEGTVTDQQEGRSTVCEEGVSDEQLMLDCQKGKVEALEQLYARYYQPIFLFILRMVQRRDLAEDLAQETFLRVFNNRMSWQPKSKFTSWMYRIARNLSIDEKRRYWNRMVYADSNFRDASGEDQGSFLDRVPDKGGDARDAFAHKIDEEAIKNAINQLSDEQREVIVLNKYQGLSYVEIADILDATPESIKQRAYRAHLKLREILQPMLGEYA